MLLEEQIDLDKFVSILASEEAVVSDKDALVQKLVLMALQAQMCSLSKARGRGRDGSQEAEWQRKAVNGVLTGRM